MSSVQWSWPSSNGIRISIPNMIVSYNKEFYPQGNRNKKLQKLWILGATSLKLSEFSETLLWILHIFEFSCPKFPKKNSYLRMSIFLISWTNIGTSLHHLTTPKQHEIISKLNQVEIAASWLVTAWCFEAGASIAVKQSVTKHKLLRSTMDLNLMLSPYYLGAKKHSKVDLQPNDKTKHTWQMLFC